MSDGLVRVGVGTRFIYDGELMQVIEIHAAATGMVVVLRSASREGGGVLRVALRELLYGDRARVVPDGSGPQADDEEDPAGVVLSAITESERSELTERAATPTRGVDWLPIWDAGADDGR